MASIDNECLLCGSLTPEDCHHELTEFERTMNRLADIERRIEKIDDAITKTKDFIQSLTDTVGPIIDKLSKNPILKGFLS
jgi:predicted transcriptional regulator